MMARRIAVVVGAFVAAALCAAHAASVAECTAVATSARQECYPWSNATANNCFARGCCWDDAAPSGTPACFHAARAAPVPALCAAVNTPNRLDCFPEPGATEANCVARGCCWSPWGIAGMPWCFHPHRDGYEVTSTTKTPTGTTATLQILQEQSLYGNEVEQVQLQVWDETDTRVHFKLTDPATTRWEPADVVVDVGPFPPVQNPTYAAAVTEAPFGIEITRVAGGQTLFNSSVASSGLILNGLTFSNQFLELSTTIGSDARLYGLGEHVAPFLLPTNGTFGGGQVFTEFTRDQGTPQHTDFGGTDLYGVHMFIMNVPAGGGPAYGIFLLNSNPAEVILQPGAITFRTIGGVLDFYVLTGPGPLDVIRQYTQLIGKPFFPPYWSLGFQLCQWGYGSLNNTMAVVKGMKAANLPQDVQWNDIDYMDKYLDFTTDPVNYPASDFAAFVEELHEDGQHYMAMFDPGIADSQPKGSYPAYDIGTAMNVWINTSTGAAFEGIVWPGKTVFPDFLHPNATAWWSEQVANFHKVIAFDGMWIDMNEPDSFCSSDCVEAPGSSVGVTSPAAGVAEAGTTVSVGTGFDPRRPPYVPGAFGGQSDLDSRTVSLSAVQHPSLHYNVHNLFGWSEQAASRKAMDSLLGKRSITISRSTFAGSGRHGGHWLGDNWSTWHDLWASIPGILSMNMFGISLVGADVCGFNGNTTAQLCARWMQLGAFYPFYRNHNSIGRMPQAPYLFDGEYREAMRGALLLRYSLLPFWYTQFYDAHVSGTPIVRGLAFEFPNGDPNVVPGIDHQFMVGSALLISPVLTENATSVDAYFPDAVWYDWFSGHAQAGTIPGWFTLDAPLTFIPVHIRGGNVVVTQAPAMTTTQARLGAFNLTVALDSTGGANGTLYLDDGESLDSVSSGAYSLVEFSATVDGGSGLVSGAPASAAWAPASSATLQTVRILGVSNFSGKGVTINGAAIPTVEYDGSVVTLSGFSVSIIEAFKISW